VNLRQHPLKHDLRTNPSEPGAGLIHCRLQILSYVLKQGLDRILREDRGGQGVLAYNGRMPIGWCSIAPRETYVQLERSIVGPYTPGGPTQLFKFTAAAPGPATITISKTANPPATSVPFTLTVTVR
jgi:hypothetical protein